MTRLKKYEALKALRNIDPITAPALPTRNQFFRALAEGRVCGDYEKRIVIVSNNPSLQFILVVQ